MTATSDRHQTEAQPSPRFLQPQTAVEERIDQLVLTEANDRELQRHREKQANWLKSAMAIHWKADLPQPFVGFDLEEGLFIAEWQSDTECNTLTIDAASGKGRYDPWPGDVAEAILTEEIDLNTEEGWECLRNVLTGTRP